MGSKKETTTQSSQTSRMDPALQAKYDAAWNLGQSYVNTPYQAYGGQLAAGFTGNQNASANAALSNLNGAQSLNPYGSLTELGGQNIGTIAGTDLSKYMNPYTDQVINNSLSDLNTARKQALQVNGDTALAQGAFGGDRHALVEAQTNKDYMTQAGNLASNLRLQGYQNAQNMANSDIGNRLNQLNFGLNLANAGLGAQNSAVGQLFGIGTQEQSTNQTALDKAYAQYLEGRDWNKNNAAFLQALASGTPFTGTTSGTQTQRESSGNGFGNVLGSALGLGALAFTPLGGAGSSSIGGAIGGLLGIGK